ncbi:deoxycytidine triphosphate deaminase [Erythrobacter sp. NAP1]|uniref:hypothetical protein n=1 Tax=Erythrobacter sp. NAP1 TaxID=237727 RepID=UPI000068799E|nr:hypothetical protein [Erythrobacter sp. NAP1]EAQ28849.1 deoxycytidine triphosphate deaminase [Erythrobacter sp. NAP1]
MIPAGYLLKRTKPPPGWLKTKDTKVEEVCSVSACVNDDIVELLDGWQFNKFGLANTKDLLLNLAQEASISLEGTSLFFYEIYEHELDSDGWFFDPNGWQSLTLARSSSIEVDVSPPEQTDRRMKLGYDVVAYGDFPDHSPLSCNSVATKLRTNRFCLFDDFYEAKEAVDTGKFGGGCEMGLYRIMSVYRLEGWQA